MNEFGHISAIGGGLCIDSWGAGPFVITDSAGKSYRFEDSDQFGPFLIDKRGEIRKRQPGERSDFWRVHRIWKAQGRRLREGGVDCIWDEPDPTVIAQISGRTALIIKAGGEDGRTVVLPKDEAEVAIAKKLAKDST